MLKVESPDGSEAMTLELRNAPGGYVLEDGAISAGGETWQMTQRQLTAILDAAGPALGQAGVVVVANNSNKDAKGGSKPNVGTGHSTPGMPDPDDEDEPKYVPSKKHDRGGWGSKMDLDAKTAQNVLKDSVQAGKQRYGYFNGRIYKFQPDNAGGWHGYPAPGNEAPTSVLRALRNSGQITRAEYTKLIKGMK